MSVWALPHYSPSIDSMMETTAASKVPNGSEPFRAVPNSSADFGTVPNASESFRTLRHHSERSENHTLTVREVARRFEDAGVARTERSIVNWCQPNKMGVARLDCYFDPNERKYFITPQSVELAIAEEQAKAAKLRQADPESEGRIPSGPESSPGDRTTGAASEENRETMKALEQEVMDLKIVNRGKDYFIEQLQKEREGLLERLITNSQKLGELETRLLQLNAPIAPSGSPQSAFPENSPEGEPPPV